jgi:hypothetical protein
MSGKGQRPRTAPTRVRRTRARTARVRVLTRVAENHRKVTEAARQLQAVMDAAVIHEVQASHAQYVEYWKQEARAAAESGQVLTTGILQIDFDALREAVNRWDGGVDGDASGTAAVRKALRQLMARLQDMNKVTGAEWLALAAPVEVDRTAVQEAGGSAVRRALRTVGRSLKGYALKAARLLGIASLGAAVGGFFGHYAAHENHADYLYLREPNGYSTYSPALGYSTRHGFSTWLHHAAVARARGRKVTIPTTPEVEAAYRWMPLLYGGIAMVLAGGGAWLSSRFYDKVNKQAAAVGAELHDVDFWVQLSALAHSQAEALQRLGLSFNFDTNVFENLTADRDVALLLNELQSGPKPVFRPVVHRCMITLIPKIL